ncbi:transferase [Ancylobacter sp. A5.8]|uniref:transferase n=1 Tax=Ancylobacter gelatini TaxID=2919920 RepID=UPI001F4E2127|nr:transferase [Ancylobacter gelatini]MCJ8142131.1 transferase [Ancylobacter gelatini]
MLQGARVFVAPASSGAMESVTARTAESSPSGMAAWRGDAQSVTQLMRQHLDLAAPRTDAEALRLLRQAFPSASLAARVTAMAERAR